MTPPPINRRRFIKTVGAAALSAPFITRHLISAPPSGVLRHASFGAAGMAWSDIQAICSNPFVKLVAVAEVDFNRLEALEWNSDRLRVENVKEANAFIRRRYRKGWEVAGL